MKKQLLAMALTAAFGVAGAQAAQPGQSSPMYFGAQLALADVDGFDDGLSLVGTLGFPADHLAPNLSFEAELGMSMSDPDRSFAGQTLEASYWYLAGFGVYSLPLNNNFELRGKLGLGYIDVEVDTPIGTFSDDDIEAMFGLGLIIPMNNTMRFITEYTHVESDIDHLSAGVQFDF